MVQAVGHAHEIAQLCMRWGISTSYHNTNKLDCCGTSGGGGMHEASWQSLTSTAVCRLAVDVSPALQAHCPVPQAAAVLHS